MSIVAEDYQELQAELSVVDLPEVLPQEAPAASAAPAALVKSDTPAPADMEMQSGHCMSCKETHLFKPERIAKRKVGTDIVLGPCEKCGKTVSRIRGDKDAKPKSPDASPKAKKTPSPKAAVAGKKRSPKASPADEKPAKKKRSPPAAKKQKKAAESSEDDEVTVKGDAPKKKRSTPKKAAAKKAAPSKRASLAKKVNAMERRGKGKAE